MAKIDVWNPTVKIIRNKETPEGIRKKANMLLDAYNIAGGSTIMQPDLELFVKQNKKYIK